MTRLLAFLAAVLLALPAAADPRLDNSGSGSSAPSSPATNSVKGIMQGDGTTLTCTAGVCSSIGGASFVTAVYSSNTATLTLPATNLLIEVIRQGIPAALTVDLPSSPSTNLTVCIKDGGNNFAANAATVKTTDGLQVDGVAGATGIVMNQNRQYLCFIADGSQWDTL